MTKRLSSYLMFLSIMLLATACGDPEVEEPIFTDSPTTWEVFAKNSQGSYIALSKAKNKDKDHPDNVFLYTPNENMTEEFLLIKVKHRGDLRKALRATITASKDSSPLRSSIINPEKQGKQLEEGAEVFLLPISIFRAEDPILKLNITTDIAKDAVFNQSITEQKGHQYKSNGIIAIKQHVPVKK